MRWQIELNADRGPDERAEFVIVNTGDRPVQIGSHIHLPDANTALDFDPRCRPRVPPRRPSGHVGRFEPVRRAPSPSLHCAAGGGARYPAWQSRWESLNGFHRPGGLRVHLRPDGPATRSGWRHRSVDRGHQGPHCRRRGVGLRRRQVGARVDEPVDADPRRRCARHRHHQRDRPGLVGDRASRCRRPRRPHRRARPLRQPRYRRRRAPRPRHRAVDRRHRGEEDPHRRCYRLTHVHLLSPSQLHEALATGITTVIGGGTGPSEAPRPQPSRPARGTCRRCTAHWTGCRSTSCCWARATPFRPQGWPSRHSPGPAATKVHEDWGSTPAAIDSALTAADEWGLQVALHSGLAQRAGFVDSTVAAIDGRSIHAFHVEGAGGGHAPDILSIAGLPHIIPGSTNPTLPHTVNTVAEHLDMLMVCHHPEPGGARGPCFRRVSDPWDHDRRRGHPPRHGALSITSSDAQAMGRIGEVITRTWRVARHEGTTRRETWRRTGRQSAHAGTWRSTRSTRRSRTASTARSAPSNRASSPTSRYGSRSSSACARRSSSRAVRSPGPPSAIRTPQSHTAAGVGPPDFRRRSRGGPLLTFVSPAALDDGLAQRLGCAPETGAAAAAQHRKKDKKVNDALPIIDIAPDTFAISINGEAVTPAPAERLPWPSCTRCSDVRRDAAGRRPAPQRQPPTRPVSNRRCAAGWRARRDRRVHAWPGADRAGGGRYRRRRPSRAARRRRFTCRPRCRTGRVGGAHPSPACGSLCRASTRPSAVGRFAVARSSVAGARRAGPTAVPGRRNQGDRRRVGDVGRGTSPYRHLRRCCHGRGRASSSTRAIRRRSAGGCWTPARPRSPSSSSWRP